MVITAPIAPTGAPCAPLLESARNAPLPATEIPTERTHGRGVVRCEETGKVGFPAPCTLCHYHLQVQEGRSADPGRAPRAPAVLV